MVSGLMPSTPAMRLAPSATMAFALPSKGSPLGSGDLRLSGLHLEGVFPLSCLLGSISFAVELKGLSAHPPPPGSFQHSFTAFLIFVTNPGAHADHLFVCAIL